LDAAVEEAAAEEEAVVDATELVLMACVVAGAVEEVKLEEVKVVRKPEEVELKLVGAAVVMRTVDDDD